MSVLILCVLSYVVRLVLVNEFVCVFLIRCVYGWLVIIVCSVMLLVLGVKIGVLVGVMC